ncbi:MAG: tryptophan halogenase family protein [Pirellulaceae bacterium]
MNLAQIEPSSAMAIQKIVIVGGGTAGWMTASLLERFLRSSGCQITVLDSPTKESIGVGEATVPSMVRFLRNLDFEENEWMQRCHATYKLGIRFDDFSEVGKSYWHPFGLCGGIIDGLDLFHFWVKGVQEGQLRGDTYAAYSLQRFCADLGKGPRPIHGSSSIVDSGGYAFHLDALLLADYLREKATQRGVRFRLAEVERVELGSDGAIQHLQLSNGQIEAADLYIDCSGFSGQLISAGMHVGMEDWSDYLLCDRAVTIHLPVQSKRLPFTKATGLSAGWMWQIPLSQRTGCGYVYSSQHLSDDDAVQELMEVLQLDVLPSEARFLNMTIGRRTESWVKNCVAVGLASGFVEPMESTGIFMIQYAVEKLMECFPDKRFHSALIRTFNDQVNSTLDHVRDFIQLHYLVSQRSEPFWQASRAVTVSSSLHQLLEVYDEIGEIHLSHVPLFPDVSHFHILSGSNRLPRRTNPLVAMSDFPAVLDILSQIRHQNREEVFSLPTMDQLMDSVHQPQAEGFSIVESF